MNKIASIFSFVHYGHFDHLEWSKWLEIDNPNGLVVISDWMAAAFFSLFVSFICFISFKFRLNNSPYFVEILLDDILWRYCWRFLHLNCIIIAIDGIKIWFLPLKNIILNMVPELIWTQTSMILQFSFPRPT